jgi:hypothetical protein
VKLDQGFEAEIEGGTIREEDEVEGEAADEGEAEDGSEAR